jgi:hypothetical protein
MPPCGWKRSANNHPHWTYNRPRYVTRIGEHEIAEAVAQKLA